MNLKYIKSHYGIDCYIGQEVEEEGTKRKGVIVKDSGHYVGVNMYDEKPCVVGNYHPSSLIYHGKGKIRKLTRSQKNYQEYLKSESDCSFAEYMGFKKR